MGMKHDKSSRCSGRVWLPYLFSVISLDGWFILVVVNCADTPTPIQPFKGATHQILSIKAQLPRKQYFSCPSHSLFFPDACLSPFWSLSTVVILVSYWRLLRVIFHIFPRRCTRRLSLLSMLAERCCRTCGKVPRPRDTSASRPASP
ncbi:hypothetical protein B0H12DRAFT_137590 [Mycena haematopus]|nr:hypothetical protein B0H12DRAFT_137590 [Mycena haematopus]